MPRLRSLAILLGGAAVAVMVLRHARGSAGVETPGGIVKGDAATFQRSFERGERNLSLENIDRLARALAVDLPGLMTGVEVHRHR